MKKSLLKFKLIKVKDKKNNKFNHQKDQKKTLYLIKRKRNSKKDYPETTKKKSYSFNQMIRIQNK